MNRPGHAPCTAVSAPQAGVVLLGPTAAGKTEVAHLLAARLKIPILSADSMLVYRGMDIGTAKPSRDEIV
ncbi:MAG: isopentenyl transferase family protein, partial [Kiritimatiellia bacterium]|nr:isopentenyl transferase family protein [Kiritimatiellia bacterium]